MKNKKTNKPSLTIFVASVLGGKIATNGSKVLPKALTQKHKDCQ